MLACSENLEDRVSWEAKFEEFRQTHTIKGQANELL